MSRINPVSQSEVRAMSTGSAHSVRLEGEYEASPLPFIPIIARKHGDVAVASNGIWMSEVYTSSKRQKPAKPC